MGGRPPNEWMRLFVVTCLVMDIIPLTASEIIVFLDQFKSLAIRLADSALQSGHTKSVEPGSGEGTGAGITGSLLGPRVTGNLIACL